MIFKDMDILDILKAAQQAPVLTKDKNVPPAHQYSHREGEEDRPRFYYQDDGGNLYRYTNAPTGHSDHSNMYGDPQVHESEPQFETNPEYFTPDGKKLNRCPECDAAEIEWNERYNRYDPQNMWAGRWMDASSGDYRYTYLDSDIRKFPRFRIHQQNAIVDVQIPSLREYIVQLFDSTKLKDQFTAVCLALLDQGRIRATELAVLTPDDVRFDGNLVYLGNRRIYAGPKLLSALEIMKRNKAGDEPLFAIPLQDAEGKLDQSLQRRVGPNYLQAVLDQLGISLLGLQTYHSTLRFCQEVKRAIERYQAPWDQAVQHGLLSAALEWGHDFTQEMDASRVMQLVQAALIDPLIIDSLKRSAEESGMLTEMPVMEPPPAYIPIPAVSLELTTRTREEEEFSQWIHSVAIHEYANEQVA